MKTLLHLSLVAALLAAGAVLLRRPGPQEWPRPNVLLVSIDTLRADHLSCYGYGRETSPAIDALAASGVRFAQALSPTSWTLPAHMTLLTGIAPVHHGVNNDNTKLSPGVRTLAEVFQASGYRTAAFVSGIYLSPVYGFSQGFETYDDSAVQSGDGHRDITSPALEKLVTAWLRQWRSSPDRQPFFLFLHMWDPHYDFAPPSPYNTMFNPGYDGPVDGRAFVRSDLYHPDMEPRDFDHLLALYDGEIRYTDDHLGRIIAALKQTGEFDNTVIAVTSDHGEEFFEHGRKGHRMTLYDEMVHVPLVMRFPAEIPAGTVVEEQVRLRDVSATLLSLAGIRQPPEFGLRHKGPMFQPVNLMPWVRGRGPLPLIRAFGDLHGDIVSVRTARFKHIVHWSNGYSEYYDLVADPGEQNNIHALRPREIERGKRELILFTQPVDAPRSRPIKPEKKHLDRLRSLGYIK